MKNRQKIIPFKEWAVKWCEETGTTLAGFSYQCGAGCGAFACAIKVINGGKETTVLLYPRAVAEVCGYLTQGQLARGWTAKFLEAFDFSNDYTELVIEGGAK